MKQQLSCYLTSCLKKTEGQIEQISNDMLLDKICEEYPVIKLHAPCFIATNYCIMHTTESSLMQKQYY
jgi:hypothetical protein